MAITDQIRDENLQYDINRKATEISALSSGKIDKYEYLTGKEILPSNQQQPMEQAKFTYSALGKGFEKQIKIIKDQGENQIKALEDLKPKEQTKAIEGNSNNQSMDANDPMVNEAMAQWLRCWIPNPGVPCSKPQGGSKSNSAFHPSEVNKVSTRNFWGLSGKK